MYIKIYFNEKPLFLCDAVNGDIHPFLHHDDAVFIDELNTHTVKAMIHEMQQENVHAGVFFHPDLDVLKKTFFKKFTLVQAAGGLVSNPSREVLLIFRRGKWDLPKGKLDPGETLEACALREVNEETGLVDLVLDKPLPTTYHTYHEGSRFVLKESHWYSMHIKKAQQPVPQQEEDIHQAIWVPLSKLKEYEAGFFPSIRDLVSHIH